MAIWAEVWQRRHGRDLSEYILNHEFSKPVPGCLGGCLSWDEDSYTHIAGARLQFYAHQWQMCKHVWRCLGDWSLRTCPPGGDGTGKVCCAGPASVSTVAPEPVHGVTSTSALGVHPGGWCCSPPPRELRAELLSAPTAPEQAIESNRESAAKLAQPICKQTCMWQVLKGGCLRKR